MNESRSFVSTWNKRNCQAGRTAKKKEGEAITKKRLMEKVGWLHHPHDLVAQFYLCFFLASAAPTGGPCKETARVKLDNRIVKIMLSKPPKNG